MAITPGFEVQGDPYEGATGNFDKMGISCGALQWNIGQGSLQPIVKAVGRSKTLVAMPTHGQALWDACHTSIGNGLAIVRGWQSATWRLNATAKSELRALMGSAEGRAQQDLRIAKVADIA